MSVPIFYLSLFSTESQTTYSDWQITHTDAESNIIIQTNDAYGRLIEIKEHNGAEVYTTAYVYDISGNLTKVTDDHANITQITDHTGDNTQIFQYDDLYRITQATGHYGTKIYQYDSIGNLKEKDGITYNYGEAAGPHALTSDSRNKVYTYDNNGNMKTKGDTTYTWDCENRLTKVTKKGGLPFTLQLNLEPGWNLFSLPYDPQDNTIAGVLSSLNFGTDYDQVSRYNSQTDKFESYVNDAEYNEFNTFEYGDGYQIHVTNPEGCALTITGTTPEITHNYNLKAGWNLILSPTTQTKDIPDALNNLNFNIDYDQVTRYNNENYEHYRNDPVNDDFSTLDAGNSYYLYALQDTSWQIEQEVIETEFVYDGDGGRVKKITPTETTTYIGSLFEKKDDITTKHIFLGSTRVCSLKSSGTTAYYHQDHLGSTSIITDENGQEVQRVEYTPFGTTSKQTGENATDYKFTGKELDATTGLYYYSARYYDPQLGRFISPDSIVQAPYDPQTLNRYSYCRNNPVKYIDPSGHSFWKKIRKFFGQVVSAVVGIVTTVATGGNFLLGMQAYSITNTLISSAQALASGVNAGKVFGSLGAGLAIGLAGGGMGISNIANLGLRMGAFALQGAAIGAAGSAIMGGNVGMGAIGGAVTGAAVGFATSQQVSNWCAGDGFLSNKQVANRNYEICHSEWAEQLGLTKEAGQIVVSKHARHVGLKIRTSEGTRVIGKYPNPAQDPNWSLRDATYILGKKTSGFFGSSMETQIQGEVLSVYGINGAQKMMLDGYINQGPGTFALTTNCTDWAAGALRSTGIYVPESSYTSFGFADPNAWGR